jgi:hypothetical protein
MLKKRPCKICRRWFYPDRRVGERQRACSKRSCQEARRSRTQASWRRRNRDYFTARRLQLRQVSQEEGTALEPLQLAPPLSDLPWDIAQDEFGPVGTDFLGYLGRVLLRTGKDQRRVQVPVSIDEIGRLPLEAAQDQSHPLGG